MMDRRMIGALVTAASAAVWLSLLWPTDEVVSARKEPNVVRAEAIVPSNAPHGQRAPAPPKPAPSTPPVTRAPVGKPAQQSPRARAFGIEAPNDERSASVSAMITQFLVHRSEDAPADDSVLVDVDCRETSCRISTRADDAGKALLAKLAAFSPQIEMADTQENASGQLTAYVALPAAALHAAP